MVAVRKGLDSRVLFMFLWSCDIQLASKICWRRSNFQSLFFWCVLHLWLRYRYSDLFSKGFLWLVFPLFDFIAIISSHDSDLSYLVLLFNLSYDIWAFDIWSAIVIWNLWSVWTFVHWLWGWCTSGYWDSVGNCLNPHGMVLTQLDCSPLWP